MDEILSTGSGPSAVAEAAVSTVAPSISSRKRNKKSTKPGARSAGPLPTQQNVLDMLHAAVRMAADRLGAPAGYSDKDGKLWIVLDVKGSVGVCRKCGTLHLIESLHGMPGEKRCSRCTETI